MRYVHPGPAADAEITELLDPPRRADQEPPTLRGHARLDEPRLSWHRVLSDEVCEVWVLSSGCDAASGSTRSPVGRCAGHGV